MTTARRREAGIIEIEIECAGIDVRIHVLEEGLQRDVALRAEIFLEVQVERGRLERAQQGVAAATDIDWRRSSVIHPEIDDIGELIHPRSHYFLRCGEANHEIAVEA